MHDIFAAIATWVTATVYSGGYVGIAVLTFLENVFPPVPSELILPVAGFLVRDGQLVYVWVVVAATIGSLLGALVFYWIGSSLGEERIRAIVCRYGRWIALDERDLDQPKGWFERHGQMAVLVGRLVPSLRSLISIPAGVAGMPLGSFVLNTTVGSAIWNGFLVGAGWLLGDQWERVTPFLDIVGWGTLLVVAAGIAWWVTRRRSPQPAAKAQRSDA